MQLTETNVHDQGHRSSSSTDTLQEKTKSSTHLDKKAATLFRRKSIVLREPKIHTPVTNLPTIDSSINTITENMSNLSIESVKTTILNNRSNSLIEEIEMNADGLWYALCVAGEAVIPCSELFSLISSKIETAPPSKTVLTLQQFCLYWLKQNKNSPLISEAQQEIEKIIAHTKESSERSVKKQSLKLYEYLLSLSSRSDMVCTPIEAANTKIKRFDQLLSSALTKNSESYKKAVKIVAKDLRIEQRMLYSAISPHEFLPEYYHLGSPAIDAYNTRLNLLSNYVIDSLLMQKEFEQRIELTKFFIDVATECLALKDYSSACAITLSFANAAFTQIPNTLAQVNSSQSHHAAL
ncbi:MAG: hypothetical protein JSR46_03185, partial [Verrucomicrobia bacterium]|nr:hypothetical protein [Verrucomicrobiota bacterium]